MPKSDNHKAVAAYLPLALYDKLEDFKHEEDIKSDSKAINTILERWLFGEVPIPAIAKTNRLEERLSEVEEICRYLRGQVSSLVALAYENSIVPNIAPSTIDNASSELPILSYLESVSVPGTIKSDMPDTVPSTIDSEVPDTVPSTIDSEVPDTVPSTIDDGKIIICLIDRDIKSFRYWQGFDRGFGGLLQYAKFYKSEATVQNPMKKILADPDYAYILKEPIRFELRYNTVGYFKQNPQFQPKGS